MDLWQRAIGLCIEAQSKRYYLKTRDGKPTKEFGSWAIESPKRIALQGGVQGVKRLLKCSFLDPSVLFCNLEKRRKLIV